MRKLICLITAALLCMGLGCQAFAAEHSFVPSITYKGGPEIESAEMNSESVGGCLVVTTIQQANNKNTDVSQDARDQLLDVYGQLCDGTMMLPPESGNVIRELIDLSFRDTNCIQPDHGHEEELEESDVELTVTFDLDIPSRANLKVYVYHDGEWKQVEKVTNNGGSVTCVFEDICPVAFCVDGTIDTEIPKTGDALGDQVLLCAVSMAASAAVLVIALQRKRKA